MQEADYVGVYSLEYAPQLRLVRSLSICQNLAKLVHVERKM